MSSETEINRPAVARAVEMPPPLGVSPQVAAVMALDQYPLSPVDVVRIQRVADVMREFLGGRRFDVAEMITAPSQ